jgi:hypothetical protein
MRFTCLGAKAQLISQVERAGELDKNRRASALGVSSY